FPYTALFRSPEAGQGAQGGGRQVEQAPQRPVPGQQAAGGGDGVEPADPGAEEQRQQLGIGEHRRAMREQLLARTFAAGPVADVHGGLRVGWASAAGPLRRGTIRLAWKGVPATAA